MDRYNEEGIPRHQLLYTLGRADLVRDRRARGTCFLCSGTPINAACLCEVCMTYLSPEELKLVEFYNNGVLPY